MLINNLSIMFLIANNRVAGTHNTKKYRYIIQYIYTIYEMQSKFKHLNEQSTHLT